MTSVYMGGNNDNHRDASLFSFTLSTHSFLAHVLPLFDTFRLNIVVFLF